jgi:hypothetical protein
LLYPEKEKAMNNLPLPVSVALLCLSTLGCSAKVDVATDSSNSQTTTKVELDVLHQKAVSCPRSARNPVLFINGDDNTMIAAEHFHLHLHPSCSEDRRRKEESHDEECRRLRQEHYDRVARWKAMWRD